MIPYHKVVRRDRFAEDMAEVYRRVGAPESEFAALSRRENRSGSEVVSVSDESAALIRGAFRQDYELLKLGAPA